MSESEPPLEMKQVKIEKLEKSVGQLALGGSPFGACYGADISAEECGKVLEKAIQTGVTYIDTAPFYGQGIELKIGGRIFLKNFTKLRHKIHIHTVTGFF